MSTITILIIFALFITGSILYSKKKEKDRSEKMSKFASRMGYRFEMKPNPSYFDQFASFQLFSSGRSKKIRDRLSKTKRSNELDIFGYQYTTGSGKHSHTYRYTVVSLQDTDYQFPSFDLRPQHFLHNIGKFFGYQDIDFSDNQTFSEQFLLRGDNESAIHDFFNPDILDKFIQCQDICVEARNDRVIFYRNQGHLEGEEINLLSEQALALFQLFCRD